jgi:hypothetical protein
LNSGADSTLQLLLLYLLCLNGSSHKQNGSREYLVGTALEQVCRRIVQEKIVLIFHADVSGEIEHLVQEFVKTCHPASLLSSNFMGMEVASVD